MSGISLPLLPKRVFDFGSLATGSTQTLRLVDRIDISQYVEGVLEVRVHAGVLTGGQVTFDLLGDGYTDEDPGSQFITGFPLFSSVALSFAVQAPQLTTYGGTLRGHYASLRVTGLRLSAAALNATVSLSLILRCPNDRAKSVSRARG